MITIKQISVAAILAAAFNTGVQATPVSQLEGIWKAVGYGRIEVFKDGAMEMYHTTDISCTKGETIPREQADHLINRIDISEAGKLSHYFTSGYTRYDYTALPALPENCVDKPNLDPEYNFDVFWHAYNDNYAFFDLHGVDWGAVYKKYRPQITKNTSGDDLFEAFSAMLAPLNDGHVNVDTDTDQGFNAGELGTMSKLIRKPVENRHIEDVDAPEAVSMIKGIIAKEYLKGTQKSAMNRDIFTWGWAAKDIGYISIDAMSGLVSDEFTGVQRMGAVDRTMDQILTDLKGAKALIVDARWNGGGRDENGLAVAAHLTDRNLIATTKKTWLGDHYSDIQQVFIPTHVNERFTGPIAYLQSRDSFSATEIFSMAMQAIPNVTSFGENTGGALSDVLGFPLPNGWSATISNEAYLAIDGKSYESIGIPADVSIPVKEDDTLESYLVRVTDAAIEFLNKQ